MGRLLWDNSLWDNGFSLGDRVPGLGDSHLPKGDIGLSDLPSGDIGLSDLPSGDIGLSDLPNGDCGRSGLPKGDKGLSFFRIPLAGGETTECFSSFGHGGDV